MNTTAAGRLPFLDGLRVAAFALLIPFHVGMYYVTWDWHVKSPNASAALEPFMMLSTPWRLGLLFLIAGAACQDLAVRRGVWGAVRDRSVRLLLPLVFGMAVIVPPQTYYEVLTKAPALLPGDGSYLAFWRPYLHGGRFCGSAVCVDVPTWNHLWFLPYLWLYAVLGILISAVVRLKGSVDGWPTWTWLLVPAVPLAIARVFVFPHHPSTHNLTADLYNHLQYGLLFAVGWASRTPLAKGLWPSALKLRWVALGLSLLGWAALVAFSQAYAVASPPQPLLDAVRGLRGSLTWWAILAACGWSQRAFTGQSAWLRQASAGVFCFYILHQTLIVVLSQWLSPLRLHWGIEGLALILLTGGLSWLAYQGLRRMPWICTLFGIRYASRTSQPVDLGFHRG
ncbi:MAG: acyltransferase [Rubrivivax sp.]|nr:acyltransferase [Rubrivivax sp.]